MNRYILLFLACLVLSGCAAYGIKKCADIGVCSCSGFLCLNPMCCNKAYNYCNNKIESKDIVPEECRWRR